MVEGAPRTKIEEQYPLLKVDGGGGDGTTRPQTTPTLVTAGWGVTCRPKQSWLVRWPEYVSACWMTCILLAISFLVFYALGMEAYRRQPVLLVKCNGSKPASDVFYHQIVPRGSPPPVLLHKEYLSHMANQYPLLNFHVYFLMDDSLSSGYRVPRHPRFINTLMPMSLSTAYPFYKLDEAIKRQLMEFQNKYQNVNVTIMPLSKYMAMTPLKYKWKTIPIQYLSFYARVFSVWQYGGVGIELNNFNTHQLIDRRINAILKQHNDGIIPEEYTNALYKIECEEESEFFTICYKLIQSIFNETRTLFSKGFQSPEAVRKNDPAYKNEPLMRTHRNKKDITVVEAENNDTLPYFGSFLIFNSTDTTDLKKVEYLTSLKADNVLNKTATPSKENNSFSIDNRINLNKLNKSETWNSSEHPQVVLFYDFSVFTDGMVPPFVVSDALSRADTVQVVKESKPAQNTNTGSYGPNGLLSLDPEGLFVAASAKLHPFLGHLMSAGCQRMRPRSAIQNNLLTQCPDLSREDPYCNSIYLL